MMEPAVTSEEEALPRLRFLVLSRFSRSIGVQSKSGEGQEIRCAVVRVLKVVGSVEEATSSVQDTRAGKQNPAMTLRGKSGFHSRTAGHTNTSPIIYYYEFHDSCCQY